MTQDGPTAKVALTGPEGEVETLWAWDLGEGRYRLDNLPYFAYGYSWGDIVSAAADKHGQLWVSGVVEKSGNRTVRVITTEGTASSSFSFESQQLLDALVALGCGYEGANPTYVAVNIPPNVDLEKVLEQLEFSGHEWEMVDPTYEQYHGVSAN